MNKLLFLIPCFISACATPQENKSQAADQEQARQIKLAEDSAKVLKDVGDCADRYSITSDEGTAPIEGVIKTVQTLCSITSSRLYSLYSSSGALSSDGGKSELKEQQEKADKIIDSAVKAHREKLIIRRNGPLGDEMKKARFIVKQCAKDKAPIADDYVSDAKTIALNLAGICRKDYERYVEAYALMAIEDDGQRSEIIRRMLQTDLITESFLFPVIANRKSRQ